MKRLLLLLFVMMAMVLASCDSGSKEYKDWKDLLSKFEKAIDKAKNCDDLEKAYDEFEKAMDLLEDKDYTESQEMTDEEEDAIDALSDLIEDKYDRQEERLCDDDY